MTPGTVDAGPTWSAAVEGRRESDAPAVITAAGTLSAAELLRRAGAAADWLDAIGVPPGTTVPGLLTTSLAAATLLVAGAGSARPLAPMGVRLPPGDLTRCFAAHQAAVLVTEPAFSTVAAAVAEATGARVEVVPDFPESSRQLDPCPAPDSVAVVMHTSGTTGVPKLVPVGQGRLAARVRNSVALTGVGPGSVYATMSPFHHIAGVGNVLITLATGAALVSLPRYSEDAWRALAAFGLTHALLVPTMIDALLEAGALRLPTLQVLQYGATSIHPDTLTRLLGQLADVKLVQIYGMTEGSPLSALTPQDHQLAAAGRADLLLSVGRAAPEVELRILDPGAGGTGEVLARAPHVFMADEDGWLHTGDVGRLDDDGYLYLVGRTSDLIIRGGEHVHPLEVEQVLMTHPAVGDAAVVGVRDQRWGEVVKAFVVAADAGAPPDEASLRNWAAERLARFKVPGQWAIVAELPRNENGKVLRRALRSAAGEATWTSA